MDAALVLGLYHWATGQAWLANLVVVVAQNGIFVLPIVVAVRGFQTLVDGDRLREAIIAGGAAAVLAFAIGLVLERTLHRPRPFLELGFPPLFPHADDSSFPSDHTLVGIALVGPLLWRASRTGSVLVAWGLVVGFARVCAGVHYPSDILGSAFLAVLLDGLAWYALPRRLLVRFRVLRSLRSDVRPPDNPP
ncbi:MAG TPA: phosphatase PAP2 family protein [Chloroflexota bacterium]|nr:phosphatase PAP2 family protein [Chloroflexota bacterium]